MRVTLTDHYVLVETDDIDFSTLRLAVEEYYRQQTAVKDTDTEPCITPDIT